MLNSLDPELVNEILKNASKKTKRIFFFLAEFYNHPWKKELSPNIIDSGRSVITIEKSGKFLKDYALVIPRSFDV